MPKVSAINKRLTTTKVYVRKNKLFLQNEPNFRKSQMNLTDLLTINYVQMDTWSIRKNEPKTNPNEPKTNPILANKMPIRTQTNPIQTQFMLNFRVRKMLNLTITPRPDGFRRSSYIYGSRASSLSFDNNPGDTVRPARIYLRKLFASSLRIFFSSALAQVF